MSQSNYPWQGLSRPDEFARISPRVQNAQSYLLKCIDQIQNDHLKNLINTALSPIRENRGNWMLLQNAAIQKAFPILCSRLRTPVDYHVWWGAPAAAEHSHHPYPGGWLMHNSMNLHSLNALIDTAQQLRDIPVNTDALIAGMLLHDCIKPRLCLWQNGQLTDEQGECGHHVAAMCEAYLRGFPLDTIRMLAGVHAGWWQRAEVVAGFMEQIADVFDDPQLARIPLKMELLPEAWIVHQAEASFSCVRRAFQTIKEPLRQWIKSTFPEAERVRAEWWIMSQCDELQLARYLARGKSTFVHEMMRITEAKMP